MLGLRTAVLSDARAITEVHCSDIKEWVRHGQQTNYEFLTISERWAHGGPWMSVETCTIHINNLLLAGHLPLVATVEGSVIAEAEIYLGIEPSLLGLNANISVFYVHRAFQGRGVGRRLMQEAIELSLRRGCHSITVHNPAVDALEFYARCGFKLYQEYDEYNVRAQPYEAQINYRGLPSYGEICELPLQMGRYQSHRECYDMLRWEQNPGSFALPGLKSRDLEMNAWLPLAQGQRAFLALRPMLGVHRPRLYLYSPHLDPELIRRGLGVAYEQQFREATLLLERGAERLLQDIPIMEKRRGQKVLIFSP